SRRFSSVPRSIIYSLVNRPPPTSTLFPYTTLFRSDNVSTLTSGGKENEAESWLPIQQWVLSLRRRGISVLVIHHAGRNGEQRGRSEEHTSELQSLTNLVCRLLLEKKNSRPNQSQSN